MYERLIATLKNSGHSITHSRRKVFEELNKSGPMTIAALSQKCSTLDRATVYRTMALFEQLGVVNRIWYGLKSQVELSEIFLPHHHHAVCQSCGQSIDIVHPELENLISRLAHQHNFLALGHSIELSGYCANCQQRQ